LCTMRTITLSPAVGRNASCSAQNHTAEACRVHRSITKAVLQCLSQLGQARPGPQGQAANHQLIMWYRGPASENSHVECTVAKSTGCPMHSLRTYTCAAGQLKPWALLTHLAVPRPAPQCCH
jgi:hypothetical protein